MTEVTLPRLPIACPWCGRTNDRHAGVRDGDAVPSDGDYGICWGCRRVLVFTSAVGRRRPICPRSSTVEVRDAEDHADVRTALAAMVESYTPLEALELTRRQGEGG